MNYRPPKMALRKLNALAHSQAGYFTAKQAAELGYKYSHLAYHVNAKNFERVGHGLYRLPQIPLAEQDDLVRLTFWSRDRDDQPQAVASHQTALAIHELSDLLPTKTHLTVPAKFRKAAAKGIVLHRGQLEKSDIEEREGFSVTTPLRTILDVADDKTVGDEHLRRAVKQALERGLVRKANLLSTVNKASEKSRLSRMIATVR